MKKEEQKPVRLIPPEVYESDSGDVIVIGFVILMFLAGALIYSTGFFE